LGIVDAFAAAAAPAVDAASLTLRAAEVLRDALVPAALLAARAVGVCGADRLAAAAVASLTKRTAANTIGAAHGVVDAFAAAAAAVGAA
jgi:hypothetical protein